MIISITILTDFIDIYNKISQTKIKTITSYKLACLYKQAKEQFDFYNGRITNLIQEYGARDENHKLIILDDNSVKLQPEFIEICKEQMDELNSLEVEIKDIYFTLEDFKDIELSPDDILKLLPFIKTE